MRRWRRAPIALVAAGVVTVLAGCVASEDREAARVASQEAQLSVLMSTADGKGAEVIGRIDPSEVGSTVDTSGIRLTSDFYVEWPKYYKWSQTVELHLDGPRTPARVADDLEPWLAQQGWTRDKGHEFPPDETSFTRYYRWGGYLLELEAFTEPPPRAQAVRFMIVTPDTDPDAPSPTPTFASTLPEDARPRTHVGLRRFVDGSVSAGAGRASQVLTTLAAAVGALQVGDAKTVNS